MKLTNDFQELITTYRKLLRLCADALTSGYDEAKREQVRQTIEEYLDGKDVAE